MLKSYKILIQNNLALSFTYAPIDWWLLDLTDRDSQKVNIGKDGYICYRMFIIVRYEKKNINIDR